MLIVLALGALVPAVAAAQAVRVEIEVRNTASPTDDYLTWAPAPARIHLVAGQVPLPDEVVVLTNDPQGPIPEGRTVPLDGDVLFAESVKPGQTATQETLKLTLPGNGAWKSFVVAGKFGRPSSHDKDAIIEVHRGTADGPLVGKHPVMVRIRKDIRTLTTDERNRFLEALANLHFSRNEYVPFVDIHEQGAMGVRKAGTDQYWPDQSHKKAGFLPWHRAFLLLFERVLQKDYPDVALPYWRLSEPSDLFTPQFIGANPAGQGEVVDPSLAPNNPIVFWRVGDTSLKRFANDRNDLSSFNKESVSLARQDYATFRAGVEGNPHNNGHNWVGPWMQDCTISPRDPIFWVFHPEFDRLWAKWQWTYGRFGTTGKEPKDYAPVGSFDPNVAACKEPRVNACIPLGHWLDDTMWPWDGSSGPGVNYGATRPPQSHGKFPASTVAGLWPKAPASPKVADMIDYAGVGPDRLDMGFAYDDVPFGSAPPAPAEVQAQAAPPAAENDVVPLGRVLQDKEQADEIRVAALRRLANEDDAATIDNSLRILGDAKDGGEALDAEAVNQLIVQMMFTAEGAKRHAEIHTALQAAMSDPRRQVRAAAVNGLIVHSDKAAIDVLVNSISHPQGALFPTAEAIRTLAVSGIAAHADVVRPSLDSADPDVQAAAVDALLGDAASQPKIVRLIADKSAPVASREAALGALAHGVPGAAEATRTLLQDRAADLRLRARAEAAVAFRLRAKDLGSNERSLLSEKETPR